MGYEKKPQAKIGYGHKLIPCGIDDKKVSSPGEALPVYAVKQHILNLFDRHDTMIVQGETGSGKTTRTCYSAYDILFITDLRRNSKVHL